MKGFFYALSFLIASTAVWGIEWIFGVVGLKETSRPDLEDFSLKSAVMYCSRCKISGQISLGCAQTNFQKVISTSNQNYFLNNFTAFKTLFPLLATIK